MSDVHEFLLQQNHSQGPVQGTEMNKGGLGLLGKPGAGELGRVTLQKERSLGLRVHRGCIQELGMGWNWELERKRKYFLKITIINMTEHEQTTAAGAGVQGSGGARYDLNQPASSDNKT